MFVSACLAFKAGWIVLLRNKGISTDMSYGGGAKGMKNMVI